jgi:hypothetical protein
MSFRGLRTLYLSWNDMSSASLSSWCQKPLLEVSCQGLCESTVAARIIRFELKIQILMLDREVLELDFSISHLHRMYWLCSVDAHHIMLSAKLRRLIRRIYSNS